MKNSKKIFGLVALMILCGTGEIKAYEEVIPNRYKGLWKRIKDENITLNGETHNKEYVNGGLMLRIEGNSNVSIKNGLKFDIKSSIPNEIVDDRDTSNVIDGIKIVGTDSGAPTIKGDSLNIKMETTSLDASNLLPDTLRVENGANINIKNVNIDIKTNSPLGNAYILQGMTLFGDGDIEIIDEDGNRKKIYRAYPDREINFITENTTINLVNNSIHDNGVLTGLIIGREVGKKATEKAYFESSKTLNINLIDNNMTLDKDKFSVFTALKVIGEDSKIVLNNSNIKVKTKTEGKLSYKDKEYKEDEFNYINEVISIGDNNYIFNGEKDNTQEKLDAVSKRKSGTLESKGKMIVDSTEAPNLPTISMHGIEAELKANFKDSSSEIKSGNTAIKYYGKLVEYSVNGKDQTVSFKNAKISSNSTNNSVYLIDVDENVNNAKFNLTGKDSLAQADNGKLLFVRGNGNTASDITLNITNGATIVGEVDRAVDGQPKIILDGGAKWKLDKNKSTRSSIKTLEIKNSSILDASDESNQNYAIKVFEKAPEDSSIVNDGGIITLVNSKYNDTLNILGNYEGKNNAQIKMNTLWNNGGNASGANSQSDKVEITGLATGTTRIIPVSATDNTKENIIDGSIQKVAGEINTVPVVIANKNTKAGVFVGKAQTTGAGEVQLTSRINSSGEREFYWTLNAANTDGTSSTISSTPQVTPTKVVDADAQENLNQSQNQGAINEKPEFIPIFAAVTPAYVNISKVNRDLGYTTIATLHERRGENDIKSSNTAQAWARVIGKKAKDYGKNRFSFESDIYGVQAGYDFSVKTDESGKRNTGVYFSNLTASTDFFDKYRAENGMIVADKYTGKVKTRDFSLGATTTKYYSNGLYLDLVGQVSFIKNKFNSRSDVQAKQNGKAIVLSAETGRTHKITENFTLEPQIQLIYQNLKLKDFSDGLREVHYGADSAFRGRIGLRGTFNKDKATESTSFYTLANIWHDFNGNIKANIGQDKVEEKYAKNMGEIGLGIQIPVTKTAYVYSDVRYEKELRSDVKHKGYRGTFGFKYSF